MWCSWADRVTIRAFKSDRNRFRVYSHLLCFSGKNVRRSTRSSNVIVFGLGWSRSQLRQFSVLVSLHSVALSFNNTLIDSLPNVDRSDSAFSLIAVFLFHCSANVLCLLTFAFRLRWLTTTSDLIHLYNSASLKSTQRLITCLDLCIAPQATLIIFTVFKSTHKNTDPTKIGLRGFSCKLILLNLTTYNSCNKR